MIPKSKYRGVTWHSKSSKWKASVRPSRKILVLGYFDSEVEAAIAYDSSALYHFGPCAKLNFPYDGTSPHPVLQKNLSISADKMENPTDRTELSHAN